MARNHPPQRRDLSSPLLGGFLLTLIFLVALAAAGPWHLRMGFLALALGALMIWAPPIVRSGKPLIFLAAGFLLLGLAPFLPAGLFGIPEWRQELHALGVETGSLVAIQWKPALESHLSYLLLFLSGLWILSQRFSATATRNLAFAFVMCVAVYALISKVFEDQIPVSQGANFGFFPNRNHNSNLLSLGLACGLGAMFQAVRSQRYLSSGILLMANGIILWAILSWNISRSGIVLCLAWAVVWLFLLGKHYFGRQEWKALGLVALLVGGIYGIAEFGVKDRIDATIEKISGEEGGGVADSLKADAPEGGVPFREVDFRVPIAMDTAKMIADAPLTGVGAGQFRWVFPQYRHETIVSPNNVAMHPESSWMWLAAELGIPAVLCLLVLVVLLFRGGLANIKKRGNRDWALRLGCLVAAALVPLHSLFDVPAHRPSLYLAALFLFVLSQNPVEEEAEGAPVRRWPSFALAFLLVVAGVRLLGTSWFGWTPPHLVDSRERLNEGAASYHQLSDFENPVPPFQALALREEISKLAEAAAKEAPLDGRFYRLSALASLPIQFESEKTARSFEIDRLLTPYSVKIPLLQASAALFYDREVVEQGWSAALERAKAIDEVRGKDAGERERVLRNVASAAKRNPELKEVAEEIAAKAR
ncbi:O-antigen ligase family protein [Verrucomicrobiaceae bacterium 227]